MEKNSKKIEELKYDLIHLLSGHGTARLFSI